MATAYTPILQLALPVTGELQGTWGTVVNDNITSMIEQAIAGLATINTWTTASHTLTTANGTTSEARCAVLECSGAPGAAATVICPASTKLYVIKNSVTGGYAVTLKTSAGTGISVPNGSTALLYCDGTNVVSGATYMATVSTTQVDILAQGDLRLQDSTGGEYVALQAPATIAASYTLTLPVDDGTAGQALVTDGNGVLSWSTAASGDVYGPASATDNAVARYDGTTGKIIQNSVVTIADDGATVIDVNSTSAGLRITQVGTGNALLVEDSANPDATPFVVNASGQVSAGFASNPATMFGSTPQLGVHTTGNDGIANYRAGNDVNGAAFIFQKTRGADPSVNTVVQSGDNLGVVYWTGADGTGYIRGAQIAGQVDGTPGTNDMPGRLVFSTTADGASSPTERMRIDQAGRVGLNGTNPIVALNNSIPIQGGVQSWGNYTAGQVQSGVTTSATYYGSGASTAATAFTVGLIRHFAASQGTFGAGSTVTTQYGFAAEATLTGATNNYGFYGDIASGTGRYNFYAAGTATNYFEGSTFIGGVLGGDTKFAISGTAPSAGGGSYANRTSVTFPSAATAGAVGFDTSLSTTAAAYTLSNLFHYNASQSTIGAGSAVTNQYGFTVQPTLIGATNNYGFFGNIASGTGRWNFYAAGTAANVFVGTTSLGGAVGSESLRVTPVASAVNYWNFTGNTAGNGVGAIAAGSDTNISLGISTKGSGSSDFYSNSFGSVQFRIAHTASAVNYLQVTGAATAGSPNVLATGSDTNVNFIVSTKGTGSHFFQTNSNASNQFIVSHTASAVNCLQVTGSSGAFPLLSAQGSSASVGIVFTTKGAEAHYFQTNGGAQTQLAVGHTASAVNYLQVTGAATGVFTSISAQGSDANVGINFFSKGSSGIQALSASTNPFTVGNAGYGNCLEVTGPGGTVMIANRIRTSSTATGGIPSIQAVGSDTNVDLLLSGQGTGNVRFGTHTTNADAAVTGYITIRDAGGTLRKLAVIT